MLKMTHYTFVFMFITFSIVFSSENPCEDTTYLRLKLISLDSLTQRQYDFFMQKDGACNDYHTELKKLEKTKITLEAQQTITDADVERVRKTLSQKSTKAKDGSWLYFVGTLSGYASAGIQIAGIVNNNSGLYGTGLVIGIIAVVPKLGGMISSGVAAKKASRAYNTAFNDDERFKWGLFNAGFGIGLTKAVLSISLAPNSPTLGGVIFLEVSLNILRDVLWGVHCVKAGKFIDGLIGNTDSKVSLSPIISPSGNVGYGLVFKF